MNTDVTSELGGGVVSYSFSFYFDYSYKVLVKILFTLFILAFIHLFIEFHSKDLYDLQPRTYLSYFIGVFKIFKLGHPLLNLELFRTFYILIPS